MLRAFKRRGYAIHLFYLWLDSVDLAIVRVAGRVRQGGHDVPETAVRRRFANGLRNLFRHYWRLLDSWMAFDNSTEIPQLIATGEFAQMSVHKAPLFARISQAAGIE